MARTWRKCALFRVSTSSAGRPRLDTSGDGVELVVPGGSPELEVAAEGMPGDGMWSVRTPLYVEEDGDSAGLSGSGCWSRMRVA